MGCQYCSYFYKTKWGFKTTARVILMICLMLMAMHHRHLMWCYFLSTMSHLYPIPAVYAVRGLGDIIIVHILCFGADGTCIVDMLPRRL